MAVAKIGIVTPDGPMLMLPPGRVTPAPFGVASTGALTVLPSFVLRFSGTVKVMPLSGAMRKPSPALLPLT